jgi:hypothetical protein
MLPPIWGAGGALATSESDSRSGSNSLSAREVVPRSVTTDTPDDIEMGAPQETG